jgi:hypothetical protein
MSLGSHFTPFPTRERLGESLSQHSHKESFALADTRDKTVDGLVETF